MCQTLRQGACAASTTTLGGSPVSFPYLSKWVPSPQGTRSALRHFQSLLSSV